MRLLMLTALLIIFLLAPASAAEPPSVTFSITTAASLETGVTGKLVATVRNKNPELDTFRLRLSSPSPVLNWVWFNGHRYDEQRHDLNVTIEANGQRLVVIDVLGGVVGSYNLTLTASSDAAGSGSDDVNIRVLSSRGGFLGRSVPGIGWLSVMIAGIMGALFLNRK